MKGSEPTNAGMLDIQAEGVTDEGCVRFHNEDALWIDIEHGIFIVADGIGGHQCGDVASKMVVDLLPGIITRRISESRIPRMSDDPVICEMLAESVNELSRYIHNWSKEIPEITGIGSTVVVALVTDRHVHVAHMGDSRAYLLQDGKLRLLTQDHSIVGLLMQHGEITAQEAEAHPAKGRLTRYVGMEAEVGPGTQAFELKSRDRILLCTDGLWGMVAHENLTRILADRNDPLSTCRHLVSAGKEAGGADNLTAVVIDLSMRMVNQ